MNWTYGAYDAGVWTGLTDAAVKGTFEWTDGTPLEFSYWSPSRPRGHAGSTCGEFYPDYFTWATEDDPYYNHWDNVDCSHNLRAFICKKLAETM